MFFINKNLKSISIQTKNLNRNQSQLREEVLAELKGLTFPTPGQIHRQTNTKIKLTNRRKSCNDHRLLLFRVMKRGGCIL